MDAHCQLLRYRMLNKPTIEQLIEIADNPPVFIGRVTRGATENGWATVEHLSGNNVRAIAVGGPVERGNVAVYRWRSGYIAMGVAPQIVREWRGPGFLSGVVPQVEQVLSEPAALVECAVLFWIRQTRTGDGPDENGDPGQTYVTEDRADFYLWDGVTVRRVYRMGGSTFLNSFPHENLFPLTSVSISNGSQIFFSVAHMTMLGDRQNIVQIASRDREGSDPVNDRFHNIVSLLINSSAIQHQETHEPSKRYISTISGPTTAVPYSATLSPYAYSLAYYRELSTATSQYMDPIRDRDGQSQLQSLFAYMASLGVATFDKYGMVSPDQKLHIGQVTSARNGGGYGSWIEVLQGFDYTVYKKDLNTLVDAPTGEGTMPPMPLMTDFNAPITDEPIEDIVFDVVNLPGGTQSLTFAEIRALAGGTSGSIDELIFNSSIDGSDTIDTTMGIQRLSMYSSIDE